MLGRTLCALAAGPTALPLEWGSCRAENDWLVMTVLAIDQRNCCGSLAHPCKKPAAVNPSQGVPMHAVLICSSCGHRTHVPNQFPGMRVKCPKCGRAGELVSERAAAKDTGSGSTRHQRRVPLWVWLIVIVLMVAFLALV